MPLKSNYFCLSNSLFRYGLSPIQFAVYSYLVSCTGQRETCWPSMQTIAANCSCSKNSARAATDELVRRGFIRRTPTYMNRRNGENQQTNNTYFILDMPTSTMACTAIFEEADK